MMKPDSNSKNSGKLNFKSLLLKLLVIVIMLILIFSMGIYVGIRNTEDSVYQELAFDELSDTVHVYRDHFGVPSIIANNLPDLLFVQGYEITRDRTFQMEYYRSLINGEISRLLGPSMVDTDMGLRDIGLKRAALHLIESIEPAQLDMVNSYKDGVNKYLDLHDDNQPFELQVLGVKAKAWDSADVVAMGSIVAFSWALGGMSSETSRLELIEQFGNEKALELLPVEFSPARDYLLNVSHELSSYESNIQLSLLDAMRPLYGDMNAINIGRLMSNNWVVSGSKTESGHPILANDPHQGLEAQGIWYRVNLFLKDGTNSWQGMTFPGIPLITFGRNNYVAWGITAGLQDATDLYYLNTNEDETAYLVNNTEWVDFTYEESIIEVKGAESIIHRTKLSIYGPMIQTNRGKMAMRWTLHEGYSRDKSFKSLIDFCFATNVDEFHEALRYLLTGFNFVMADVDGNIASQVSGFIPIRKKGFGMLPQNGSSGEYDWLGLVPYDDQYYVKNPASGYLATANQRVDTRELFYISEGFAHRYRYDRISRVLDNGTDFEINPASIKIDDMKRLQLDIKTLVPEDLLIPILDDLKSYTPTGENKELYTYFVKELEEWDWRLKIDSVVSTVFVTYRYMLTLETLEDELGSKVNQFFYSSIRTIGDWFVNNRNSHWFDNNSTLTITEDAGDIAIKALLRAIKYLVDNYGQETENWKWGDLHKVWLIHPLNSITNIFNIGGDPISGGIFTIMSSTENAMHDGKIDFECNKAPYFRFIVEVEPSWENIWGAVSSGASDHPLSPHYSDAYKSWVAGEYNIWENSISTIEDEQKLTAVFRGDEI